ncbi:hypothetical protein A2U01_0048832 [Trifolium medium]|uniref:Uncharacterized protein n=1 Tax=Trifolium medium TaxID=97028 RepID=A0A392QTD2_9FABA|nr:hypothetical protein [Trifolium medium]
MATEPVPARRGRGTGIYQGFRFGDGESKNRSRSSLLLCLIRTLKWKRANKIMMLRNEGGEWIEEESQLQSMVNNFYKELVEDHGCGNSRKETEFTFPSISSEDVARMKESGIC